MVLANNKADSISNELTSLTIKQITNLFDQFLSEADNQLIQMAEVAASNEQQSQLFEAKALLRTQGDNIRQQYCAHLEERLRGQNTKKPAVPPIHDRENMQLMDLKEFEDWLSTETIIRRGNERYHQGVACLEQRYSHIANKDITGNTLPFSVDNICHAMQETFKGFPFSADVQPVLYRLFDQSIIHKLDDLYDSLNSILKSQGILPNIESQIHRRVPSKQTKLSSLINQSANPAASGQNRPLVAGSPAIHQTAKTILGLLRQQTNDSSQQQSANTPAASAEDIIAQLSSLQKDSNAVADITNTHSLSQWFEQQQDLLLDNNSRDLITLTDSIFQTINNYPQISENLTSQLNRLQIPIAQAALLDSSLLSDQEHPVHALLNQLIDLCVNSDMPNPALEKKFDSAISNIANNFQKDPAIFSDTLDDLATITTQQNSARERNTKRIAQTYEGRQQVQKAQEAVEREIQRRISPPTAPEIVIELLNQGWRELLKLTYIRLGPDNETWHEQLATLDQLLLWVSDINSDDPSTQTNIEKALEADTFTDYISQQLHNIFPGDYRFQDTIEKIRDTLKGNQAANMVELTQPLTTEGNNRELLKELEAANPQLSRWFKRAKNLKPGEEFSYLDDDSGQRNIKLAWVSENQQHFVFVNNRGQKVFDYDLVDIANELPTGLSPVEEQSEVPLVERSLYSTVQHAYEKLAFNSSHDELTGLISRKECEKIIGDLLLDAKNNGQQHCLLYIDIDNFSLANNLHGHVAGDQLIIDTSQVLKECVPENPHVARMAGNEFVILLQHKNSQESHQLADEIRRKMANHSFNWQTHSIQFTISIGLITISKYTENVIDLMRNAISASQIAKTNGGNRIHDSRQDTELHNRREKLLAWIDKLNNVLNSNQLVLRGQPICPTENTDQQSHYEILVALKDDEGELISPAEFIEAAECYNRMQKVDRWVIENTFKWLSKVNSNDQDIPSVSINLSGNSINDDQFLDFILEQFAQYKIPTTSICFEVTETATINNLTEAADFIREIKRIGCQFSLDDFGSGNASYQYLKYLPVDYLKIDGMFVKDIANNKNDYALVKSINEIAHLMGKKTIAEYAENDEIIAILKEIGVDYIQGYGIAKPEVLETLMPINQAS